MRKFFHVIFTIIKGILWIAVLALLGIVLTQRISDNKMALAGIRIFNVATESMTPVYKVGDAVLVMQVDPSELKVGDDVTYLGEKETFKDKIITHRIIEIEKKEDGTYKIKTQGIANTAVDPSINETQIYGRVIYKINTISYINGIIGDLYGMYFIIIVPMAIMIFFDFFVFGRKDDKEDEDEEDENQDKEDKKKDAKEEKKEQKRKAKRKEKREKRRKRRGANLEKKEREVNQEAEENKE